MSEKCEGCVFDDFGTCNNDDVCPRDERTPIKTNRRREMKVYAVCDICEDPCYGDLAPRKIFKDKEMADAYARELYDDGWDVTVREYELE